MKTTENTNQATESAQPQHTPGPWEVFKQNHRMRIIGNRRPKQVPYGCEGMDFVTEQWHERRSGAKRGESPVWHGWTKTQEANARLIAAAPELLEALKRCVDLAYQRGCGPEMARVVSRAIARADGRES